MSKMIANVQGKEVRVMQEDGRFVRHFRFNSDVTAAYVSGDQVNVQLSNGHREVYKTDGRFVRRF